MKKTERERKKEREGEQLIRDIANPASCLGSAKASRLTPQTVPKSALEKAQRVLRKTSCSDSGGFFFETKGIQGLSGPVLTIITFKFNMIKPEINVVE